MRTRLTTAALAVLVVLGGCRGPGRATPGPQLDVVLVTDEAEAVLAILDLAAMGRSVPDEAWQRLFGSEGYRRLQARETAMARPFTDDEFRAFVLSPGLAARRTDLAATLEAWRSVSMAGPARRAFDYLPAGAAIRARVYPVIKPKTNSFVFEPRTDPAIFLYLDPEKSPAQLANVVAHELHHIGLAGACSDPRAGLPKGVRDAVDWMGGFGEGLAMLAAAGGATAHPHAVSPPEERAVWDAAVARLPRDMERLEGFFLDLLAERLTEEEAAVRGFRFIVDEDVPQGPFYTVGWYMGALIERELGRERVLAGVCDPAALVREYDRAAGALARRTGEAPPRWSRSLLEQLPGG